MALQVTYLLKGLFGRACRSLGGVTEPIGAIREECGQLRGLLAAKLAQINTNLEGEGVVQHMRVVERECIVSACLSDGDHTLVTWRKICIPLHSSWCDCYLDLIMFDMTAPLGKAVASLWF
jgi:hypothetical protein